MSAARVAPALIWGLVYGAEDDSVAYAKKEIPAAALCDNSIRTYQYKLRDGMEEAFERFLHKFRKWRKRHPGRVSALFEVAAHGEKDGSVEGYEERVIPELLQATRSLTAVEADDVVIDLGYCCSLKSRKSKKEAEELAERRGVAVVGYSDAVRVSSSSRVDRVLIDELLKEDSNRKKALKAACQNCESVVVFF